MASVITMLKQKIKMARTIKGIEDLERRNTVHPQMNQIVIVTKIHQKTHILSMTYTVQKMKFSIKDVFSKCDEIRCFLQI